MEVTVNGAQYRLKESNKSSSTTSKKLNTILSMSMMMGAISGFDDYMPKMPERPNVDIVEEYGLIQLKKSRLSKSQRDWVVSVFESKYERIKN